MPASGPEKSEYLQLLYFRHRARNVRYKGATETTRLSVFSYAIPLCYGTARILCKCKDKRNREAGQLTFFVSLFPTYLPRRDSEIVDAFQRSIHVVLEAD